MSTRVLTTSTCYSSQEIFRIICVDRDDDEMELSMKTHSDMFTIHSRSLQLQKSLDYEQRKSYTLQLQ